MEIVAIIVVAIIIGAVYEQHQRNKTKATTTVQTAWVDFGDTLEILGKTFVKDGHCYTYKGLYFAQCMNGASIYGFLPAVSLTKGEFLEQLNLIKE